MLYRLFASRYLPREPQLSSETFHYKKGANQQFCQPTHVFNPAKFAEDELQYDIDRELIPIAIHCVTEEGPEGLFKFSFFFFDSTP